MRNKKAQAAMEFLLTYGWAILVVLAIIGVFILYIMPRISTPDVCDMKGELKCDSIGYDYANGLIVQVQNVAGVTLTLEDTATFKAASNSEFPDVECTLDLLGDTTLRAAAGASFQGTCTGSDLQGGDTVAGLVTIRFIRPPYDTAVPKSANVRFSIPEYE